MAQEIKKKAGVSGNSVAGKSYQIFTVSEELLAKVVEAVQAGEKEARSSGNIQSFEVYCHGFRANISLGRIMVVPAKVCSDRKNFPTALLHGALVRVFGWGGEEIADLIEKKIGDSEFDEYSQADFDTLKESIFTDVRTGEEASLVVFAPNWMNSREYICFHFSKDAAELSNNLRHQVFSAYYNPAVSSAFNALMTNVDTTKVDVTDITPKLSYPFLTANPLKQFPQLEKQGAYKKATILLNRKTADEITKQTLDPQELDVFDSLNQALEQSLLPDADGAQGEGGFKAPEAKPGVPHEASSRLDKLIARTDPDGIGTQSKIVDINPPAPHETPFTNVGPETSAKSGSKVAHIDANGICPGCKKAGADCACAGCTCKAAAKKVAYKDDPRWLTSKYPTRCKKCGRSLEAGSRVFYYPLTKTVYCDGGDCGEAASQQFGAESFDERQMTGSKEACAPHETPFTNVGPGTSAHDKIDNPDKAMKESVKGDEGKEDELHGGPIGIAIDETGVPRRKEEEKQASLKCRYCGKPTEFNFCSTDCAKKNNAEMAQGNYASPEEMQAKKRQAGGHKPGCKCNFCANKGKGFKKDEEKDDEKTAAANPSNRKRESSHPETLRVDPTRLSSAMSATFNGGYRDVTATDGVLRPYTEKTGLGDNAGYPSHAANDHKKQIEAGAYGEDGLNRRSNEKWGSADVRVNFKRSTAGRTFPTGDDFTDAYIEAALWAETDPDTMEPLDKNHDYSDIAPATLERFKQDCAKFQKDNAQLLEQAYQQEGYNGHGEWSAQEQAGHDFWLTRNGHGAGFWDRDALKGGLGDQLTTAAKAFREADLYVGDDGMIYQMGAEGTTTASYVAAQVSRTASAPYEAISDRAKKARTKKESLLDKFRPKTAVELDIDSIWDAITEDMGPAPVVELDADPNNPSPSNTEQHEGFDETPKAPSKSPNKKDVQDLPEAFRSDKPEEDKSINDSEAESQETDLENEPTKSEEHEDTEEKHHESSWGVNNKYADFVNEISEEIENEEETPGMSCDQCQMLQIQGVPCHESGCPNMGARWDAENGSWVKQRECRECGSEVDVDDPCCSAPMEEEGEPSTFGDVEASGSKRIYEDAMINNEQLLKSIKHGDRVTIMVPAGRGRNGQEWKEATGTAVMHSAEGGWVLNMGGQHGTPGLANERNIVKVRKGKAVPGQERLGSAVEKEATGEMSSAEANDPEEWPIHHAIAQALGGQVKPFDQYQGPYILIGSEIRGEGTYAPATPMRGTVRLWVQDLGTNDRYPMFQVYNEDNEKLSEPFIWNDEAAAVEAAKSTLDETPPPTKGKALAVGASAKKADTADNGYDIDKASNPSDKETGPSDTVECHKDYDGERSEGTDRPKPEAGADIKQSSRKKADTADNPANWKGGEGIIQPKTDAEVKDTTGPDVKSAGKKGADVSGDFSEAKSETVSVDTVDADIQQPTVSVSEAAKVASTWMNEYEIDEAAQVLGSDPVVGKYVRFLKEFVGEVNSHSDGWPYWKLPAHAASQLMTLVKAAFDQRRGYTRHGDPQVEVTEQALRRAMGPIKSFYTRRGTAAGMQMPKLAADISGDMSEAKSEVDYNKGEMADNSEATDTVNPEHFAAIGERNDDVPVAQGDIPSEKQPKSDLSGVAPEAPNVPPQVDEKVACGEDQPESIQFDFGAGDLADIVLVEDEAKE